VDGRKQVMGAAAELVRAAPSDYELDCWSCIAHYDIFTDVYI
jgi:hypothetical protein